MNNIKSQSEKVKSTVKDSQLEELNEELVRVKKNLSNCEKRINSLRTENSRYKKDLLKCHEQMKNLQTEKFNAQDACKYFEGKANSYRKYTIIAATAFIVTIILWIIF